MISSSELRRAEALRHSAITILSSSTVNINPGREGHKINKTSAQLLDLNNIFDMKLLLADEDTLHRKAFHFERFINKISTVL